MVQQIMSEEWQYQVRIDLPAAAAELARRNLDAPDLQPIAAILARHRATLTCQFDAFAGYVAEAEREGIGNYPLYEWTKKTIEDPAKKAKYLQSFTFYIEGQEVYPKAQAAALVADLQPLVDKELITRIAQYDTNPANNPQPPPRPAT
jgi:hypothetical protein